MRTDLVTQLAHECGFELVGVTAAAPLADDFARYERWIAAGMGGKMGYLADRRASVRRDPRNLLPTARSIICVGKLYHQGPRKDDEAHESPRGIISQYACSRDYHEILRERLEELAAKLSAVEPFEWKICADTAPLLERSYARQAGLGWIGRNTCLINEPLGSWFFLGELITSLDFERDDLARFSPPPNRCGTCTRCIEACPTEAIVPANPNTSQETGSAWTLDARRCISYLNIELRGEIPQEHRRAMGTRIFGCDICQDVCPWNSRAPVTTGPEFVPIINADPALNDLASLSPDDFKVRFRNTPVTRAKYDGFIRNVAVAMGAAQDERFRPALEKLAAHPDPLIAEHARWALDQLNVSVPFSAP